MQSTSLIKILESDENTDCDCFPLIDENITLRLCSYSGNEMNESYLYNVFGILTQTISKMSKVLTKREYL